MFERFTDRARAAVVLAQEQALQHKHDYIGTEHLLLGLLSEESGVAAKALNAMGVQLDDVHRKITETVGDGTVEPKKKHIPFTPRAKKVMELSLREALRLKHNYIGTEHLLLGLIREGEGTGARVLADLGVDLTQARNAVLRQLDGTATDPASTRTPAASEVVTGAEQLAAGVPVGSQHILAALVSAEGSLAARVLAELGVDADSVTAKLAELDPDDTTDATPELAAASKMSLRVDGDEAHIVLRDAESVDLARAVTAHGELTGKGAVAQTFLPMWTAIRDVLGKLAVSGGEDGGSEERSFAGGLLRKALQARSQRRKP